MLVYRKDSGGGPLYLANHSGYFSQDLNDAKMFADTRHFFNYLRYHDLDLRRWPKNTVLIEVVEESRPQYQIIRTL